MPLKENSKISNYINKNIEYRTAVIKCDKLILIIKSLGPLSFAELYDEVDISHPSLYRYLYLLEKNGKIVWERGKSTGNSGKIYIKEGVKNDGNAA